MMMMMMIMIVMKVIMTMIMMVIVTVIVILIVIVIVVMILTAIHSHGNVNDIRAFVILALVEFSTQFIHLALCWKAQWNLDYAKHTLKCRGDFAHFVPGLCADRDDLVQSAGRILGSLFPGSLFPSQRRHASWSRTRAAL